MTKPPNFQVSVALPLCCGICTYYKAYGDEYEDSPEGCYQHTVPVRGFGFDSVCDDCERDERIYPLKIES